MSLFSAALLLILVLPSCFQPPYTIELVAPYQGFSPRNDRGIGLVCGLIETKEGKSGTCFPIRIIGKKIYLLTARHILVKSLDLSWGGNLTNKRPKNRAIKQIKLYRATTLVTRIPGKKIKILSMHKKLDTALLEAELDVGRFPIPELSNTSPQVGDRVVSHGYPGLTDYPVFSQGAVVRPAPELLPYKTNAWVVNSLLYPGCSGGPVVSPVTGRIVGMSAAVLKVGDTYVTYVHFIIDAAAIRDWLEEGGYYE